MPIVIKNLEEIAKQKELKDFEFKDLHLDFSTKGALSVQANQYSENNDVQVDYDVQAISNSLRSLFNTRPGQRFLFPEYGLDLSYFLFEPVSEQLTSLIRNKIKSSIETYEPRVLPEVVSVIADEDNQFYNITIIVSIPIFNTKISLGAELNTKKQSFILLNS